MPTKSGTNLLHSTIEYKTILDQIAFAKQKLLVSEIPHQLRVISYLRIGCSAMQKIYRLESNGRGDKEDRTPYLSLLKSLLEYDLEWWNTCKVRGSGELKSDHPDIDHLLQPLNTFVNSQLDSLVA